MFKEFSNLVLSRQSCRDFNDKPLDRDVVKTIAETAMLAPSACNSQPWRMYCVTDENAVKGVTCALQEGGHNKFLTGAKAYIVVCDKQATLRPGTESKFDRNHFVKYDVGELIAYITLTAQSLGVASCIIGWINYEQLKQTIGYADDEICNIVVALGHTDTPTRTKMRKDKAELIKFL